MPAELRRTGHRRALPDDARGRDLHHRDEPQQGEGRPGGENEQRRAGDHALEDLAAVRRCAAFVIAADARPMIATMTNLARMTAIRNSTSRRA